MHNEDKGGSSSVTQALVHAAAVLSTRDRKLNPAQVLSADMRPLVVHLLRGLQRAGIKRVVIALGENARQMQEAVQSAGLKMMLNYVFVPASLLVRRAPTAAIAPGHSCACTMPT